MRHFNCKEVGNVAHKFTTGLNISVDNLDKSNNLLANIHVVQKKT